MKKILAIAVVIGFLISCNNTQEKSSEKLGTASTNVHGATKLPDVNYRGALSVSHEANYFVDCASNETWFVVSDDMEELANQYENIATKQYQDIYAEVKGFLEKAPDEGFADNYDKMLIITEIVKLDDLDGGNDCTNEAGIN